VFGVQGSFWPLLAVHLADLGIAGRARGWIFATLALGSAVVPLGAGQLADRLMATEIHGLGIGCFTVGRQIYIDGRCGGHLRASAQALLMVCTSGFGALLGNVLAGEIAGWTSPTDVLVFLIPCVIDGAVLLYFWRGFRASVSGENAVGVAGANLSAPPQSLRGSVARVGHLVTESADG